MKILKSVEKLGKRLRCRLSAKFRNTVTELRQLSVPIPEGAKVCLFDFHKDDIDSDMARYLFPLVHEMRINGYHIAFTDRYNFLATANHKRFKKLSFDSPFSLLPYQESDTPCDIVFSDSQSPAYQGKEKNVYVDFAIRSSKAGERAIDMPYFAHPSHQKKHAQLPDIIAQDKRDMRILFAGNAESPQYDRECLESEYAMLSRVKALDIVSQHCGEKLAHRPSSFDELIPNQDTRNKLTISTTQTCPIPGEAWLSTLAKADFFLALPGVHMPVSHNLIESIYVGAIPILQYSEYLNPKLTHGENCLVFSDELTLRSVIDTALNMTEAEIIEMRQQVLQYRDKNMIPGMFGNKIIQHPAQTLSLLMNSYKEPLL